MKTKKMYKSLYNHGGKKTRRMSYTVMKEKYKRNTG